MKMTFLKSIGEQVWIDSAALYSKNNMSVAYEDDTTPNKINEWKHLDKLADKIAQTENVSIDTFFNWQKLFRSTGAKVAYFRQEE